jgi:hypothetical protein
MAAMIACLRRSRDIGGMIAETRPQALSRKMPLGSPVFLSLTISPPWGSGVSRVFQGQRIGQRHMPIQAFDQHRMVRSHRIDQFLARMFFRRPVFMVPIAAGDPLPIWQLLYIFLYYGHEFFFIAGRAQVNSQQIQAAAGKMEVGVIEPGQHQFATQINHLGVAADQFFYLAVGTDGNEFPVAHGDCLGPGQAVFYGEHPAVEQYQVSHHYFSSRGQKNKAR